jgi:hypothetical protein
MDRGIKSSVKKRLEEVEAYLTLIQKINDIIIEERPPEYIGTKLVLDDFKGFDTEDIPMPDMSGTAIITPVIEISE